MNTAIYQRQDILKVEVDAQNQNLDLVDEASDKLVEWVQRYMKAPAKVLVLAGGGHNGADALAAAGKLSKLKYNVSASAITPPTANYTKNLWHTKSKKPLFTKIEGDDLTAETLSSFDLIIDGIFGIGLNQEVSGSLKDLFEQINQSKTPVLAVDIPSGLDAITGTQKGSAIKAMATVTFLTPKLGLYTAEGIDFSGHVTLEPLSVNKNAYSDFQPIAQFMQPDFSQLKRPYNSHKGSFGGVQILGGCEGMLGAAIMASRAAMSLGAGKVWLSCLAKIPKVDWLYPEIMPHSTAIHQDATVLVCGTGLGQSKAAKSLLKKVLPSSRPIVLDADALNLIAADEKLQAALSSRQGISVLTPHPSEAARLLGCSTEKIQSNRLEALKELRQKFNASILLKGSGSLTISTDNTVYLCTKGNPSLANAGQGDVLSGAIGAFLAQGLNAIDALNTAVYLHAKAADIYVQEYGVIGLRASISIDRMLSLLNQEIQA